MTPRKLRYKTGLTCPYTSPMGTTTSHAHQPPIVRLISWWRSRAALCGVCRKAPRRFDGYCTDECAEFDAEMQAIA
jgi:hypothetical protein